MYDKSLSKVLIIILCLVFLRGLIYGLIIPPDQFPDEFHHFTLIKAKQLELNHANEQERRDIAAQVAYSFYYLRNPETSREQTLDEFRGAVLPAPPSSLQIYYLVLAWIVKIASFDQISSEFYLSRSVSIICGIVVVFIAFLSAWELFPEQPFIIIGVPTFITFIPQFSAMNGAINNDKFAEVFAALVFLLMVKTFKHGMTAGNFFVLISVICLAILSKRSSFFLLPVFLVFIFVYWWRDVIGIKMHVLLAALFGGMVFGIYLLIKNVTGVEDFIVNHIAWAPAYKMKFFLLRPELYSLDAFKLYLKFFTVMYWSFWGVFGYMTIHLHHFWYVAAAVFQCLSICGVILVAFRVKMKKYVLETWRAKSFYIFVISIFLAMMIPLFRSVVLRPGQEALSQGRYLFPAIIPISILTVSGILNIIPAKHHRLIGGVCFGGLLLLDNICLSNYILLSFHNMSIF